MRPLKVLVFPGGTENALEIYRSLKNLKEVELFSASSPVINHAPYVYTKNHIISSINESRWINELNSLIKKEKIEYIFPSNSAVIDALNKNRTNINAKIVLPDEKVIEITRSKKNTVELLRPYIPVPEVYRSLKEIKKFPVFIKPDKGYGSQGAFVIYGKEQLKPADFKKCIVQQYLPGKEYTVDCFSGKNGKVIFAQGRTRERIRMGTSMHSEIVSGKKNAFFKRTAEEIQKHIPLRGAWFFQMKEDAKGELKLLEIDVRIAGTMALNRVRGVNFPLLTLLDFTGTDTALLTGGYDVNIDRCLLNRYRHNIEYNTVYTDLDDTLIVHDRINTELIRFLYQCVNNGKKIVLVSKNLKKNKKAYLKKWKISEIFDEIFWLKESESKADYIKKNSKSIFIDDSFSQRKEVCEKCNIPTFDNSMIELLTDERI